jgi:hypothetical protein
MARSTPTYSSGSIPAGTDNINLLYVQLRTTLGSITTGGSRTDGPKAAWVEYDVRDATVGQEDIVWHTSGDASNLGAQETVTPAASDSYFDNGDIDVFLRANQVAAGINFYIYQDYCRVDSTENRECPYSGTQQAGSQWAGMNDTDPILWYAVINEYEIAFIAIQDGDVWILHAGVPYRWTSNKLNGVARISTTTGSTGNVTIDLDRDIAANITVGQPIWLQNRTPELGDAGSVTDDFCEIVTVTAVDSINKTITVSGVTNGVYQVGSLVGLDPSPAFLFAHKNTMSTYYHTTSRSDASPVGAPPNVGNNYAYGWNKLYVFHAGGQPLESDVDPMLGNSLYIGSHAQLIGNDTGVKTLRGLPELITFWSIGTQVDGDRMLPDFNSALAYKIFPTLEVNTNWACAIGPGAT